MTPVPRVTYADLVAAFLDLAEAAGARHITYLGTYDGGQAPPQVDIRAVEADLAARGAITHCVLRPAWVMQNFSDAHLPVVDGVITVPSGGGTEAFVDAAGFAALDPFFRIIQEGLAGLVDGEHFFDLLAEDAVFEYVPSHQS